MRTLCTLGLLGIVIGAGACGGSSPPAQTAAPAEKTLFTGAPAYASAPIVASAAAAHAAKGAPAPGNKTACLTCHKAGGTGPAFVFGGSVFADGDGKKGAPDIEVRVVDAKGTAVSVHSDADGNFWAKGDALTGPAHAGARNGVKTKLMHQPLTTGDCNSCHDTNIPMLLTPAP